MQERHIVVEGVVSYWEGCTCLSQRRVGVKNTDQSLFSESDNALPAKLIHSCGVVLVLSASATLAQYSATIGECFMLTRGTYGSMEHFKSLSQIFP